jgi:hypothetical protein
MVFEKWIKTPVSAFGLFGPLPEQLCTYKFLYIATKLRVKLNSAKIDEFFDIPEGIK